MKLISTDLMAIAVVVMAVVFILAHDDLVLWTRWTRRLIWRAWSRTVGTWCARRRVVGEFAKKRLVRIRVPRPDEHSRGIMVARRDINTGVWT